MRRILAIVILSLAGAAAANAADWSISAHYGFSLVPYLNAGCQSGCAEASSGLNVNGSVGTDPTGVPEPAPFALFGAGLLLGGIVLARRRVKLRKQS